MNLPAREAAAFKSGASLRLVRVAHSTGQWVAADRGARWLFSSGRLGRHPTSSILLLPGCAWRFPVPAPRVALSLIRGAGCTDGAGFALCLLRCIQLGATASVALGEAVSWVLAGHRMMAPSVAGLSCYTSPSYTSGPAGASDGTASDGRIKVASSGLLFSPSSVLRAGQVFSLGLCSLLLDQRRHVRLVPLRGSLGTVISFSRQASSCKGVFLASLLPCFLAPLALCLNAKLCENVKHLPVPRPSSGHAARLCPSLKALLVGILLVLPFAIAFGPSRVWLV